MYTRSIPVSLFIYSYHYLLLYLCVQCTYYSIYARLIEYMPFENGFQHGRHWNIFLERKKLFIHSHKTKILLFCCDQNLFEWKRMEKISHSKSNLISLQSPIYFMLIETVFSKKDFISATITRINHISVREPVKNYLVDFVR